MSILRSKQRSNRRQRKRSVNRRRQQAANRRELLRGLKMEMLEERQLLAVAPELVGVKTNDGTLLENGEMLLQAPRELNFSFSHDATMDPQSLAGIQILRSGNDGHFTAAHGATDFGSAEPGTGPEFAWVEFTSVEGGIPGNGIVVELSYADLGPPTAPRVNAAASMVDKRVSIVINTNSENPTTAQIFVDAINSHPEARLMIQGRVMTELGSDPDYNVGLHPTPGGEEILLAGSNDVVVEPGYLNTADTLREVVFRFKEPLTNDSYRINFVGDGPNVLRDVSGVAFKDLDLDGVGENESVDFSIDLAPQVVSVVTQPVLRNDAGQWEQFGDQIHVYFNQDDLDVVAAQTRDFYRLIYTNQTVENTDDVTFLPREDGGVRYYPDADMVILTYDKPLHELAEADGAQQNVLNAPSTDPLSGGTFRLRVGTNEDFSVVPYRVDLREQPGGIVNLDAGDSFETALPMGTSLVIDATGETVSEAESFRLTDSQGITKIFEFDPGYTLLLPAEGVSAGGGVWDGQRFQIDDVVFEFDWKTSALTPPQDRHFVDEDTDDVPDNQLIYIGQEFGTAPLVREDGIPPGQEPDIMLSSLASNQDDFYVGSKVEITSGSGAGIIREITAYDGTSKIATVDAPWGVPLPSNPWTRWNYRVHENQSQLTELVQAAIAASAVEVESLVLGDGEIHLGTVAFTTEEVSSPTSVSGRVTAVTSSSFGLAANAIPSQLNHVGFEVDLVTKEYEGLVPSPIQTSNPNYRSLIKLWDAVPDGTDESQLLGMTVELINGEGAGQSSKITAYDPVTFEATVDESWSETPDVGTAYHLIRLQTRQIDDYDVATRLATVDSPWDTAAFAETGVSAPPTETGTSAPPIGQSNGADTIYLAATSDSNDEAYTGLTIAITSGTGAGETNVITSYDGTTRLATVATPWGVQPDDTSEYAFRNGANTIHLAATAHSNDDAYIGLTIEITGGAGASQTAVITDYDGSHRLATVALSWGVQLDNTSEYSFPQAIPNPETDYSIRSAANVVETGMSTPPPGVNNSENDVYLADTASVSDEAYRGLTITITGGLGTGQSRTVYSYDGSTRLATVSAPWATVPDTTSVYEFQAGRVRLPMDTAPKSDSAYWGLQLEITAGTGNGQVRTISHYDGLSKVATLSETWDTQPDETSQFNITTSELVTTGQAGTQIEGAVPISYVPSAVHTPQEVLTQRIADAISRTEFGVRAGAGENSVANQVGLIGLATFDTGAVVAVEAGSVADFLDGDTLEITDQYGRTLGFRFHEDPYTGTSPYQDANNASLTVYPLVFHAEMTIDELMGMVVETINTAAEFDVTVRMGTVGNELVMELSSKGDSEPSQTVVFVPSASGSTDRVFPMTVQLVDGVDGFSLQQSDSFIVSSSIDPQFWPMVTPGAIEEPGHRKIRLQRHFQHDPAADSTDGMTRWAFNFQEVYAQDSQGRPMLNTITETQKVRAREVIELLESYAGIEFYETENQGLTIVTGDLNAVTPKEGIVQDPLATGQAGINSAGSEIVVLDGEQFNAGAGTDLYGDAWFRACMEVFLRILGVGFTQELPPLTMAGNDPALDYLPGDPEPIFPGHHDQVHLQHLYRKDSIDIDLYRVDVTSAGLMVFETFAERKTDPSSLDTLLRLYRELTDSAGNVVGHELLAQSDDYYSEDSYLELELVPGIYYVGVSATGNDSYDPTIPGTGSDGVTQGDYDLRVTMRPDADAAIEDAATGQQLDGDLDGLPGGVYNSWFRVAEPAQTGVVRVPGEARAIFVDKTVTGFMDGSLEHPFANIDDAFAVSAPGDIVRILGNRQIEDEGIENDTLKSLEEVQAYEIGFSRLLGMPLADGAKLQVPQGVTVIIDQTAVLKLRRADFGLGSTDTVVDRSGSSLQVVGTPRLFKWNRQTWVGMEAEAGVSLLEGDQLVVTDQAGQALTFRFHETPYSGPSVELENGNLIYPVVFGATMTRDEILSAVADAINASHFDTNGSLVPFTAVAELANERLEIAGDSDQLGNEIEFQPVSTSPPDRDVPVDVHPFAMKPAEVHLDSAGLPVTGRVYFTSLHDAEIGSGANPDLDPPAPEPGDWGGIAYRRDIDNVEGGRLNYERLGIFLDTVSWADMRYGGGIVDVDSIPAVVRPIELTDARATINFNHIRYSADAAVGSNPNSSKETNFHSPEYQAVPFTADYDRVGPAIYGNFLADNSINGHFIVVSTPATEDIERLTVAGRWDDQSMVTVLAENLFIEGTPGGLIQSSVAPPVNLVVATAISPGEGSGVGSLRAGDYLYRLVYVAASGDESLASDATALVTIPVADDAHGRIELQELPAVAEGYVARRLYRSFNGGAFVRVAELNGYDPTFMDTSAEQGGLLAEAPGEFNARYDARLRIDPGVIVKIDGAYIDVGVGAQLIVEGDSINPAILTGLGDARYGRGGTFETVAPVANQPEPGAWAGIYNHVTSTLNLDNAVLAYAGGVARVEGAYAPFNPIEIHQASARIANSRFEFNADGVVENPQSGSDRFGRSLNDEAVVFVRGSEAIIIDNLMLENNAPAISVDVNSMNYLYRNDTGRVTGMLQRNPDYDGNQGILVKGNILEENELNGLAVREGTLNTEGVWDDTGIVIVLDNPVHVTNLHTRGGLRLESSVAESLVVKLQGADAGIVVTGTPSDIVDRIGGSLQILGQPQTPVVMTSLQDDSVGAGRKLDGSTQLDTNNDVVGFEWGPNRLVVENSVGQLPDPPPVSPVLEPFIDNDIPDEAKTGVVECSLLLDAGGNPIVPQAFDLTVCPDAADIGLFKYHTGPGGDTGTEINWSDPPPLPGETALHDQGKVQVNGEVQAISLNVINEYRHYVEVGGQVISLSDTTVTQVPTLIANDRVESKGSFSAANGFDTVEWTVTSEIETGSGRVEHEIKFSSGSPLGDLRLISYLDQEFSGVHVDAPHSNVGGVLETTYQLEKAPIKIGTLSGEIVVAGAVVQTFLQLPDGTFQVSASSGFGANVTQMQLNNATGELTATWSELPGVHSLDNVTYNPHGREILKPIGQPSQEDFRLMVLDSDEMVGLKQGGIYRPGIGLQNARYVGFAADKYDDLKDRIAGIGDDPLIVDDRESSSIDQFDLPGFVHANLGQVYGIGNVTSAMVWDIMDSATDATVTTFLELQIESPILDLAGDWNGLDLDQFSHDRNVTSVLEIESNGLTYAGDANATPDSSQYLGSLAKDELSSDENHRLGYHVIGDLKENSDMDVYSFTAYGGTELWFDMDRTSNALDGVVELIDADGNLLARSVNSLAEDAAPSLLDPRQWDEGPVILLENSDGEAIDGSMLVSAEIGVSPVTGDRLMLVDAQNQARIFEFTFDASELTSSQYVPIVFNAAMDQSHLAKAVTVAINNATGLDVEASVLNGRIHLEHDHQENGYRPVVIPGSSRALENAVPIQVVGSHSSVSPEEMVGKVHPLRKSDWVIPDYWALNPKDAGMRVVLPGDSALTSEYFVRVRSASDDLWDPVAGDTAGEYQLQVRLGELDESAGSTIRYADIRYATDGIQVSGLPIHSPLVGEIKEQNDLLPHATLANAQNVGNLLKSDNGTLSIAGRLVSNSEVDVYQFDVFHENVKTLAASSVTEVESFTIPAGTASPYFRAATGADASNGFWEPAVALTEALIEYSFNFYRPIQDVIDFPRTDINLAADPNAWGLIEVSTDGSTWITVDNSRGTGARDPKEVLKGASSFEMRVRLYKSISSTQDEFGGTTPVQGAKFLEDPDNVLTLELSETRTTVPVAIDIDYSTGLNRPNTAAVLYDDVGNILMVAEGSNIADDRPRPLEGLDLADHSRGSVGYNDPFFGPMELSQGTYYVAIFHESRGPEDLYDQFNSEEPASPRLRLKPNPVYARIVEDHIEAVGGGTLDPPKFSVTIDNSSFTPYHLGNVVGFAHSNEALFTVDAFTGSQVTSVDLVGTGQGTDTNIDELDNSGQQLQSFLTQGLTQWNAGGAGTYVDIDEVTGAVALGNGLQTPEQGNTRGSGFPIGCSPRSSTIGGVGMGPTYCWPGILAIQHGNVSATTAQQMGGLVVRGMTFDVGEDMGDGRGLAVASRPGVSAVETRADQFYTIPALDNGSTEGWQANVLYQFNPDTGHGFPHRETDGREYKNHDGNGPNTHKEGCITNGVTANHLNCEFKAGWGPEQTVAVARGQLDTYVDALASGQSLKDRLLITPEVTSVTNLGTESLIRDGGWFWIETVTGSITTRTQYEFELGPDVRFRHDLAAQTFVADGDTFELTVAGDVKVVEFNTGPSLTVNAGSGGDFRNGDWFTVRDENDVLRTFEFSGSEVANNRTRIPFNSSLTRSEMSDLIVGVINQEPDFNVNALVARSLSGEYKIFLDGDSSDVGEEPQFFLSLAHNQNRPHPIVVTGDNDDNDSSNATPNTTASDVLIEVEESFNSEQFATAIVAAINSASMGVTVGLDGDRMNFLGATTADFEFLDDVTGTGVFTVDPSAQGGVVAGYSAIALLAADSAQDVSAKVVTAIANVNAAIGPESFAQGNGVQIGFGSTFMTVDTATPPLGNPSPLEVGGSGPGGFVTGLASVDGEVYAVSDKGGFYRVIDSTGSASLEYLVPSAVGLLGKDLQGLVAGPSTTELFRVPIETIKPDLNNLDAPVTVTAVRHDLQENDRITIEGASSPFNGDFEVRNVATDTFDLYDLNGDPVLSTDQLTSTGGYIYELGMTKGPHHNVLFAIDADGQMHAVSPEGRVEQPFVDAQVSVDTQLSQPTALAFGSLERNLWHFAKDQGRNDHSYTSFNAYISGADPFDQPAASEDNRFIHFSNVRGENLHSADDYGFLGGAYGTVETNPFSLKGYSPADQPYLYFDYQIEISSAAEDSFRVFVSDDSGVWRLVGSNQVADVSADVSPLLNVTLADDDSDPATPSVPIDVWRQARMDLSSYAGNENVRLRFDFHTAADTNTGEMLMTGSELRALAPMELSDGDVFVMDGTVTVGVEGELVDVDSGTVFEFERSPTITASSGGNIDGGSLLENGTVVPGETFTVDYGDQQFKYEFVGEGFEPHYPDHTPIFVEECLTPNQVARRIEGALLNGFTIVTETHTQVSAGQYEPNDKFADAFDLGLTGGSGSYVFENWEIGDNAELVPVGKDVDLIKVHMNGRSKLTVDVDAVSDDSIAEPVNSYLRIFDSTGQELVSNDSAKAPDDPRYSTDSYIVFEAPRTGDYYIGVSGGDVDHDEDATTPPTRNDNYDPIEPGASTSVGSVGTYNLRFTLEDSVPSIVRLGAQINLPWARSIENVDGAPSFTSFTVNGTEGTAAYPGSLEVVPVPIHFGMDSQGVAEAIQEAMAHAFGDDHNEVYKGHKNMVRVIGHEVTYAGLLGLTDTLAGDSEFAGQGFESTSRSADNAYAGVSIDNLVVGFAETGNVVSSPDATPTMTPVFQGEVGPEEVVEGGYQVEIRYVQQDQLEFNYSLDTNDRFSQSKTLEAVGGADLYDGQTFQIGDGVDTVVFEYDEIAMDNGVKPGHQAVAVDPSYDATEVARAIWTAINSDAVQGILDIQAGPSNGGVLDEASDYRINLYGNAVVELASNEFAVDADVTAAQLVETIVGSGLSPVGGAALISGPSSAAIFSGDRSVIGMPAGIVLSTGQATGLQAANTLTNKAGLSSLTADTYLDSEFGLSPLLGTTIDATTLTFEVEMDAGEEDLYVSYLFASEEYGEVLGGFYDRMAIFVDDHSDGTFSNIALVPNATTYKLVVEPSADYTDLDGAVFAINDGSQETTFELMSSSGPAATGHEKISIEPIHTSVGTIPLADATLEEVVNHLMAQLSNKASQLDLDIAPHRVDNGVIALYGLADNLAVPQPNISLTIVDDPGFLLTSIVPLAVNSNTVTGGYPFGQNASNSQYFVNNDPSSSNKSSKTGIVYDGFTTIFTGSWQGIGEGTHTIHMAISDVKDPEDRDSALFVLAGGVSTEPLECADLLGPPLGKRFDFLGHSNTERSQGQILIESNSISRSLNHGVVLDSVPDDDGSGRSYPGGPRNLRELNHDGLIPGVSVFNNTLAFNQQGAIEIIGDPGTNGGQPTVRFDRIVNNTIYGTGPQETVDHDNDPLTPPVENTGITITGFATPTIVNNIIANSAVGISIQDNSHAAKTIVGATLYSNNGESTERVPITPPGVAPVPARPHPTIGLGEDAVIAAANEPLFVSPATNNFYLEAGSPAIDHSVKSLRERSALTTVKEPMGMAPSPVLAPELDGLGQLRVDDPETDTTSGVGEEVFADIGAIDRVDHYGPWTVLLNPIDWIGTKNVEHQDMDPASSIVNLVRVQPGQFVIQLQDGRTAPANRNGTGIEDSTVTKMAFKLYKDDQLLTVDEDYAFSYNTNTNTVYLTAPAGIWPTDATYRIKVANTEGWVIRLEDGEYYSDGDQFQIEDYSGNSSVFEFDAGYSVQVRESYALSIPEAGGVMLRSGDQIEVYAGVQSRKWSLTLPGAGTVAGYEPIEFNYSDSADTIADAIVSAIVSAPELGLSPRNLGDGVVHLGSTADHYVVVNTGSTIELSGDAGSVTDGSRFTVDDGATFVNFEFDLNDEPSGLPIEAGVLEMISYQPSQTHEELADMLVANTTIGNMGLTPVHLGDGLVVFGGGLNHIVDTSGTELTQFGLPGVTADWGLKVPSRGGLVAGLLTDETRFTLQGPSSGSLREFRFNVPANSEQDVSSPNITYVEVSDTDTADDVAAKIRDKITEQTPGNTLRQFIVPELGGNGILYLKGADGFNLEGSKLEIHDSNLTELGEPGAVGSEAVPFVKAASFTKSDVADVVAEKINASDRLQGVTSIAGPDSVTLVGVESFEPLNVNIEDDKSPAVTDRAGNVLQPNQLNGEVSYTIHLSAGRDYSDAPDEYGTTKSADGAGHEVIEGFHLGSSIDSEPNGMPGIGADGDGPDDDGVEFSDGLSVGFPGYMRVTVEGVTDNMPGQLDAWVDWGDDDSWDAEDRIADGFVVQEYLFQDPTAADQKWCVQEPLEPGNWTCNVPFDVPGSATPRGNFPTYARVRLSTVGVDSPHGIVSAGEVEDYRVGVLSNPWQNGSDPHDVNGDGYVTPLDAVYVITYLNDHMGDSAWTGLLPLDYAIGEGPAENGRIDVDGNGYSNPNDANQVISRLNELVSQAGNGEGEGEASQELAVTGKSTALLGQAFYSFDTLSVSDSSLATTSNVRDTETVDQQTDSDSQLIDRQNDHRRSLGEPNQNRDAQAITNPWWLDNSRLDDLDGILDEIGSDVDQLQDQVASRDDVFADWLS